MSGPGHAADASRSARSSRTATRRASSSEATSTGSVRPRGRSFASNRRAVAAASSGRVPIPYTVSVGRTISAPRRAAATASSTTDPVTAAAR